VDITGIAGWVSPEYAGCIRLNNKDLLKDRVGDVVVIALTREDGIE
jgi:hypothetical protein